MNTLRIIGMTAIGLGIAAFSIIFPWVMGFVLLIAAVMILIGLSVYFGFIIYFIRKLMKRFKEKFD